MALGNFQEYGLNYEETSVPVVKMTTVRTIMAMITSKEWSLWQMDLKNAFLHMDLKEEIYISPPSSMFSHSPIEVCQLKRPLYRLKQVLCAWFEKFCITLLDFHSTRKSF